MSDDKLNDIPGVHINSAIGKYEFHGNEIGMPDLFIISPTRELFLEQLERHSII